MAKLLAFISHTRAPVWINPDAVATVRGAGGDVKSVVTLISGQEILLGTALDDFVERVNAASEG